MYHALPRVFEFLAQPVGLQDVDDAQEQEESLAARVPSRNAARRHIFLFINRLAFSLYALHRGGVSHQPLSVY